VKFREFSENYGSVVVVIVSFFLLLSNSCD